MISKQRIQQSFQRAAASYDGQAMIQHRVADHLLSLLASCGPLQTGRVLEIGCCTGLLTRKLARRYRDIGELVLSDLVESFAARAGAVEGIPAIRFLAGDIETMPLSGTFDLIISSSTFHWIHDLDQLLHKLTTHLAPGGKLAFTLYGPENLQEIRTLSGIGLDYFSLAEVEGMVKKYCTLDCSDQKRETFWFADPMDVLAHLRQTGVNGVSSRPWTPRRLQRFVDAYCEKFGSDQGVSLTYHPMYLVAHR